MNDLSISLSASQQTSATNAVQSVTPASTDIPVRLVSDGDMAARLGRDAQIQFDLAVAQNADEAGKEAHLHSHHHSYHHRQRATQSARRQLHRQVFGDRARKRLATLAQEAINKASQGNEHLSQWLEHDLDMLEQLLVLHAAAELAWSETSKHGVVGEHVEMALDHLYAQHGDAIKTEIAKHRNTQQPEQTGLLALQQRAGIEHPKDVVRPAQLCDLLISAHGAADFDKVFAQCRTDTLQQLMNMRDMRQASRRQIGADSLALVAGAMAYVTVASVVQVARGMQAKLAAQGAMPLRTLVPAPVMARDLMALADEGGSDASRLAKAWLPPSTLAVVGAAAHFYSALRQAVTALPQDLWRDEHAALRMQLLQSIDQHAVADFEKQHDPLEAELATADRLNLQFHLTETT